MKSFTCKSNEKLNTASNKDKTSGRQAAPQRTAHSLYSWHSARTADNRGFSLPEIIVAMLLVGIVIVPILTNFAVTARVNAKSLKTKDVTDYAEQIVETLQSYTPDEVDEQFGSNVDGFKIADISGRTDFGRTNSSFEIGKNDDNSGTDTTEKAAQGEPRYYYIRGAKAPSGRTYDIQVTYDPRSYATAKDEQGKPKADGSVHAYNLEEFPDSAAFSRSSTAIINPNDSHVTFKTSSDGKNIFNENSQSYEFENNTSYEENAINALYGVYTAFISQVRTGFESKLDQKYNISSDFQLQNDDFSDGLSEKDKKAQLRECTNRYTLIMIDSIDGKAYLSSYLQFYMSDNDESQYLINTDAVKGRARKKLVNLKDKYDKDIEITEDDINEVVDEAAKTVRARWSADIVPSYKVFYNDDGYIKLNTVYLMTKPLTTDFKLDRIAIYFSPSASTIYNEENRLELYFVPQTGLLKNKTPDLYIQPEITGAKKPVISDNLESKIEDVMTGAPSSKLSVHYAKDWFKTSGVSYEALRGNIDDKLVKTTTSDLIYDVKVTVYESSSGRWGNKLTELNTSTQQ